MLGTRTSSSAISVKREPRRSRSIPPLTNGLRSPSACRTPPRNHRTPSRDRRMSPRDRRTPSRDRRAPSHDRRTPSRDPPDAIARPPDAIARPPDAIARPPAPIERNFCPPATHTSQQLAPIRFRLPTADCLLPTAADRFSFRCLKISIEPLSRSQLNSNEPPL
jgi:hypothetical protein